jgi:endogenous inhibitor of DNA gyrase (YacG/DUF329 family)
MERRKTNPPECSGRVIKCPRCGREVTYGAVADVPAFPFCSQRCKLVDLDKWFEGEYRISTDIADISEGESASSSEKP